MSLTVRSLRRLSWPRRGGPLMKRASMATGVSAAVNSSTAQIPSDLFVPRSESSWQGLDPQPLNKQSVLDLMQNKIPAIKASNFVSAEKARGFEDHFIAKLTPYSHVAGPRIDKVGLAQFEFQAQSAEDFQNRGNDEKDRYFRSVSQYLGIHKETQRALGDNPWARVFQMFVDMFPEYNVGRAQEKDGRVYYSGIYRAISNSTPIHCDWSPYDSLTEDWIVNQVTRQIVFNLYLAPVPQGETIVYDRPWTEDALQHRDPATYGYFPSVVQGRDRVEIQPNVGDLVFFNTRNMHEVKEVGYEDHPTFGKWKRPRLTMSSFIGMLPAGVLNERPSIIFWS